MKEIIYLVVGLVVGYVGGRAGRLRDQGSGERVQGLQSPNQKEMEEKRKHLEEVMAYFNSHDAVTNDEVEKMLNISDATAERYLDELEKQGKITQVGKTGRQVTYKKTA